MTLRRYPIGVEVSEGNGVHARVWAPRAKRVEVVERRLADTRAYQSVALEREANGYFVGNVEFLKAGSLYSFRLDGASTLYPDPMSRFQPEGPHGPSQVVDPRDFRWTDNDFGGVRKSFGIRRTEPQLYTIRHHP